MAYIDTITVQCPTTTTTSCTISIGIIERLGNEAYVEVYSQYPVTSNVGVTVFVHDDCSFLSQYLTLTIVIGNNYASGTTNGLQACGFCLGSGTSISPSSDSTYSYHF